MADSKKAADPAGESQKVANIEQEQGFSGVKVDPLPNEAHSLESGPEAPTAQEQADAAAKARL